MDNMPATASKTPWVFANRWHLFIALFLVLAIPTAIVMTLTGLFVSGELKKQAAFENNSLAQLTARQISDEFFGLRRYVESFARRTTLRKAIESRDAETIRVQLADMQQQNRKLARAVFTDDRGVLLFDFPNDPSKIGQKFSYRDWFKGADRSDKPYVSEIYQPEALGNANVVMIAVKVQDAVGETIGYLGGQYDVNDLATAMDRVKPRHAGDICVFDQSGRQAMPDRPEGMKDVSTNSVVQMALASNDGSLIGSIDSSECLISHVRVPELNWTVISYLRTETVFGPIRHLLGGILFIFFIALASNFILGSLWFRLLHNYQDALRKGNQEMERFCYSIAHDLRAPLRAMSAFTSALQDEYPDKLDSNGKHYVSRIAGSSVRMDLLIRDLLEYGRVSHSAATLTHVCVDEVVRHVLYSLQDRIQTEHAKIEVKYSLNMVRADPRLLDDVLTQLLSNALKYVGPNVTPHVWIWSEERERHTRIFVKDNGIGMELQYLTRIFGVFERLHGAATYSGTGIGLAIVQRAMDRMGGIVGVESKPGQGSTFWIELPKK